MDLQRLKYLDVASLMLIKTVFEEKGISKAGSRLSLSQSALSKTLAKLRYLFEDDLFTRVGNEMHPTPKAVEVYHQAHDILCRMDDLFNSAGFDPDTDAYCFTVECNDMVSESLFPIMLRKVGPAGSLVLRGVPAEPSIADTAVDFVFEVSQGRHLRPTHEKGSIVVAIGSLSHKIIVRADHPILDQKAVEFKDLERFPKVTASFLPPLWSGEVEFTHSLSEFNARQSIITTPSMATALECVKKGDGVLIAPIFSRMIKSRSGLEVVRSTRLKHHISPAAFTLRYSASLRNSRAHLWFVQAILESVAESLAAEESEATH